jgi:hypothetical protein
MSPALVSSVSSPSPELNLHILGLGVEYPTTSLPPEGISILAARHYPDSPAYVLVLYLEANS